MQNRTTNTKNTKKLIFTLVWSFSTKNFSGFGHANITTAQVSGKNVDTEITRRVSTADGRLMKQSTSCPRIWKLIQDFVLKTVSAV